MRIMDASILNILMESDNTSKTVGREKSSLSARTTEESEEKYYDSNGFEATSTQIFNAKYYVDEGAQKASFDLWSALVPSIPRILSQNQRKIVELVRWGVSDPLRKVVWPKLISAPLRQYAVYCGKGDHKEINLDLGRTFPQYRNSRQLQQKMKRVLNSLALAIPTLGYCQGMNFIVGIILLRLEEEDAFNVSYHILHWLNHEQLLMNLHSIHQKLYVLDRLTLKHYPRIHDKLRKHEIDMLTFASSWFITLFCSTLPVSYTLRIIQCFLLEGQKVIYRVALQILGTKMKALKAMKSIEQIMGELKDFSEFDDAQINDFFAGAFAFSVSRKQIEHHTEVYRKGKHH